MKGLGGGSTTQLLPSYGQIGAPSMNYLPTRNLANAQAGNMLKARAGLARAANGGYGDYAFLGDSLLDGFNGVGNAQDTEQSFSAQLLKFLIQNGAGIVDGGTGARPAAGAAGILNSSWGMTGAVNVTAPFLFTSAGGTATYTCPKAVGGAGTAKVIVTYHGQSNNFSFTVGGGAANNIVPSGVAQWEKFTLNAQTVGAGTAIVFTFGALNETVGVEVRGPSGMVCHNLGFGGARLNSGAAGINWNNTALTALAPPRIAMLPATVDATFVQLGGNDEAVGQDPATTAAGFAPLLAQAPFAGSDIFIILSWCQPGFDANWSGNTGFLRYAYAAAQTLQATTGATIVDWQDRVGGQAKAQANGYLGPDNVHGTYATYANFGKAIGDFLLD